ncbi:MAG: 1,4-alpha-glucan branching protein GlgB [Clostridiales bacterium]|jgi:1,4-alpha-glucan branching enzyme|nr:1,4-alpha-glucan branching protein GlgB [Clostridiales bacterium]
MIIKNMVELMRIVNSEHSDPHHILGMHETEYKGEKCQAVRAFMPAARKLTVIEDGEGNRYESELIHSDGFFEAIIPNKRKKFKYYLEIENNEGFTWESYDAYSFPPTIQEMDLYFFGEGTHYQIYEKLGAHIRVVEGVYGVSFGVWAPNAKRVSVIGDFNNWDGRRNPMRALYNSGVWELFIPGLGHLDRYKLEIKTHDGGVFEKMDPYANFFELRPSRASFVYNINAYEWEDEKWMLERKEDPLKKPMNIYEVHLGSWRRVPEENDRFLSYTETADRLIPYVKEMGYTHIELMPVEEFPFDGSWGYQVTGYYAPTSRYGSPSEFMGFVDKMHQNGIGVVLDWVPAHFPKDAEGLGRFDGSALYEHADPRQGEHPDWGTYIFNYGRNEVKNFLISNAIFWLQKYHIDGLRVDAVASMLYLDYGKRGGEWVPNRYGNNVNLEAIEFIKHMNSIIADKIPDALMIAEESTAWAGVSRPVRDDGLGFNLKWNMGWMNDVLTYMSKEPIHRKYHHNDITFSMIYAYTENFVLVLSHDEVVHGKRSLVNKMPGDLWQKFANLRLLYGFMIGHPGKKLLFMGGEFGQFDEWSEYKSIDWFLLQYDHHDSMRRYVKELNHFYLAEKSLWLNDFSPRGFSWINSGDADSGILTFYRTGENDDDMTLFVCNFTPVVRNGFRIGAPYDKTYIEVFNSDNELYGGSGVINSAPIKADAINWDGREYSFKLDTPPLGIAVFKIHKK